MRPQILKTWDQSFATVLFKHYVSPLSVSMTVDSIFLGGNWSRPSGNTACLFDWLAYHD
jgi:hypothetical protein